MTTVKVLRNGDTLGVVLPAELVDRLALHEGEELSLTEDNGTLTLRRRAALTLRERGLVDEILTQHSRTMEMLAKR